MANDQLTCTRNDTTSEVNTVRGFKSIDLVFIIIGMLLCGFVGGLWLANWPGGAVIPPCCEKEGQDGHRNPHPDKPYEGRRAVLSADGVRYYHFKVKTTGDEAICSGHGTANVTSCARVSGSR